MCEVDPIFTSEWVVQFQNLFDVKFLKYSFKKINRTDIVKSLQSLSGLDSNLGLRKSFLNK